MERVNTKPLYEFQDRVICDSDLNFLRDVFFDADLNALYQK